MSKAREILESSDQLDPMREAHINFKRMFLNVEMPEEYKTHPRKEELEATWWQYKRDLEEADTRLGELADIFYGGK